VQNYLEIFSFPFVENLKTFLPVRKLLNTQTQEAKQWEIGFVFVKLPNFTAYAKRPEPIAIWVRQIIKTQ
jgi:hypothetical protein